MKSVVFFLLISLFVTAVSPLAVAALMLNPVDLKTAQLYTDLTDPVNCFLTIPSDVGYIVDPAPPIGVDTLLDQGDGLDWISVYNLSPLMNTFDPIATITLTGPEFFGLESLAGDLTLWDETATTPLSIIPIVPEPATVSLLAIGGLTFLRKRK